MSIGLNAFFLQRNILTCDLMLYIDNIVHSFFFNPFSPEGRNIGPALPAFKVRKADISAQQVMVCCGFIYSFIFEGGIPNFCSRILRM